MTNLNELEKMLQEASQKVREAVDVSVEIKAQGLDEDKQVASLWEGFLKNFIGYVKDRGRKTGQNLMAGISFSRILK